MMKRRLTQASEPCSLRQTSPEDPMDYETTPAAAFGHSLAQISLNLLCRDLAAEVAFWRVFLVWWHTANPRISRS
jgi:hypothetical protein